MMNMYYIINTTHACKTCRCLMPDKNDDATFGRVIKVLWSVRVGVVLCLS